jgi:hypothetical protein
MTVMDKIKGHLTLDARSLTHATNASVIPERMNLYLQVTDAVVNKPYMDYLKQLYSE